MIHLFSIEDHWLVVEGLISKYRGDRDGMKINCSADNITEALTINPELFDIILLDLLIPGTEPVENVTGLKTKFPGKPIIILTSEDNAVWKEAMYEAGVQAFLSKHDSRKYIKSVIRKVAMGEDFSEEQLRILKKDRVTLRSGEKPYLKPWEKEIVTMLLQDMNFRQVAEKKLISESAITKMMTMLRKRFKVKTNGRLLLTIVEQKLIHFPPSKP
jgi:DNA-binding NarL/FixJ family response regulator